MAAVDVVCGCCCGDLLCGAVGLRWEEGLVGISLFGCFCHLVERCKVHLTIGSISKQYASKGKGGKRT